MHVYCVCMMCLTFFLWLLSVAKIHGSIEPCDMRDKYQLPLFAPFSMFSHILFAPFCTLGFDIDLKRFNVDVEFLALNNKRSAISKFVICLRFA